DPRWNVRTGNRKAVVWRLRAAEPPVGALHVRRRDALRAIAIDRHDARSVHAQLAPQLFDRPPIALDPAAVLVRSVAISLPLRPRRKKFRVVRHVELPGVRDPPTVGAVVAEENGVRVNLLQDLEVARRLNLENRLRARTEP